MPPEQFVSAKEVDKRGDVWAIGVCAYRLLSGAFPFEGRGIAALFARIVEGPAPLHPCEVDPGIPRAVADVVMRCLTRDPAARYADAQELGAALRLAADAERSSTAQRSARATPTSVTRLFSGAVRVA